MRNNLIVFPKFKSSTMALILGLAVTPWLAGCMDGPSHAIINRGYGELNSRQYDQADSDADEFLRAHPDGSGTAEAWYLKGRVAEAKAQDPAAAKTPVDQREWLERAKDAYLTGLRVAAPSAVRAQLHSGVANVDYYQEDYAGALREWQASYENIPNEDNKAWVLYQIGRCQQRLGMFEKADKTFADVERYYPGTEQAARAAKRIGMNSFYVEVSGYLDTARAEKAAADLRSLTLPASRTVNAGEQIVRIGPLATYSDAKAIQMRISKEYPKAIISP